MVADGSGPISSGVVKGVCGRPHQLPPSASVELMLGCKRMNGTS